MRVGSEGVGGMPHGAGGGRAIDAKAGVHGSAPAGGFTQLLAILQGFAAESASDPSGTGDDADHAAVDGDGEAVDDGASSATGADAASAAQIAAGVVVTLSGARPPSAVQAGGASAQSGHAKAGDGTGVAANGGDAKATAGLTLATGASVIALGRAAAGLVVATSAPVSGAGVRSAAGAKASAAPSSSRASADAAGARAAANGAENAAMPREAATAHGHGAPQGRFMLPTAATLGDASSAPAPDETRRDTTAQKAAPAPANVARHAIALAVADAGDDEHAQDHQNAADGDTGSAQAAEHPAPTSASKSALATIEAVHDGASLAVPGASTAVARMAHDQGAAARELHAVGTPAAAEPAVPRASVASGAAPGLPSWIDRVASAQHLAASRKADALHFDLEPDGLGRIEVRLSFGRDGVRAQVFAEHEHTRSLLSNQQAQLASAFERNDVHLASFLVDLGLGGEAGGDARHDPTDVSAFDETGLVSAADGDEAVAAPAPVTGLLSVRA